MHASHPMFRKLLTVRGPAMNRRGESRHANLKCFAEPGDPYGKPLPYVLAHGDLIICLDYEDFAGQTWVLHEVDERARGLRKDGAQPSSEKPDQQLGLAPQESPSQSEASLAPSTCSAPPSKRQWRGSYRASDRCDQPADEP